MSGCSLCERSLRGEKLSLRERQSLFAYLVSKLLTAAEVLGYEVTLGDAWARDGHVRGSFHYRRLAIDLNLFRDGECLTRSEDHRPLGEFWKSLHENCTWGGDFRRRDGNHYSFGEH